METAKLSGLTVKTIRYYSDIGLIRPEVNERNGYRLSKVDLAKLQFCGKARKFDFSLDECRELLALYKLGWSSREIRFLTLEKIAEIDLLKELEGLKDQLNTLANACTGR